MFILYKLTFSNGKIYIGQTTRTLKIRILQHQRSAKSGSKLPVHEAWKKLGTPDIDILGEFEAEWQLDMAEIKAICEQNTIVPNGYNLALGGNTAPSKNKSVAQKISAKATGRKYNDERRQKSREITSALWDDPEYREKVQKGLKNSWDKSKRDKRSNVMTKIWEDRKRDGWEMSDTQKDKLRNKIVSEQSRKKMSESAKKTKRTITTSSGYAGINYNKKRKVYEIYISLNCKTKYLGSHVSPEKAAKTRDKYIVTNDLHHGLAFPHLLEHYKADTIIDDITTT